MSIECESRVRSAVSHKQLHFFDGSPARERERCKCVADIVKSKAVEPYDLRDDAELLAERIRRPWHAIRVAEDKIVICVDCTCVLLLVVLIRFARREHRDGFRAIADTGSAHALGDCFPAPPPGV